MGITIESWDGFNYQLLNFSGYVHKDITIRGKKVSTVSAMMSNHPWKQLLDISIA